MQTTAQLWLVYDLTISAALLGILDLQTRYRCWCWRRSADMWAIATAGTAE